VGRGAQGRAGSGEAVTLTSVRVFFATIVTVHAVCTVFLLLPERRLLGGTIPREGRPAIAQPIGDPFLPLLNVAALVTPQATPGKGGMVPPVKVLLVGDATAWRFMGPVEYCTVFDTNFFAETLRSPQDPQRTLDWLQSRGIRYIWIDGSEVERLRRTYGFDEAVTKESIARLSEAGIVDTEAVLGAGITVMRVPEKR